MEGAADAVLAVLGFDAPVAAAFALVSGLGLPRCSTGRSGSSGEAVDTAPCCALAGEVSLPSVGREEAVVAGGAEFFSVGRSESLVEDAGALPLLVAGGAEFFSVGRSESSPDRDGLLLEADELPLGVESDGAEFFSVGRSELSFDGAGALLLDAVEFPPDAVGELLGLLLDDGCSGEPLPGARRSTGGPESSLIGDDAFFFGCLAACSAILMSSALCGFHLPSAIQFPLTCFGEMTVNHPVGSP